MVNYYHELGFKQILALKPSRQQNSCSESISNWNIWQNFSFNPSFTKSLIPVKPVQQNQQWRNQDILPLSLLIPLWMFMLKNVKTWGVSPNVSLSILVLHACFNGERREMENSSLYTRKIVGRTWNHNIRIPKGKLIVYPFSRVFTQRKIKLNKRIKGSEIRNDAREKGEEKYTNK